MPQDPQDPPWKRDKKLRFKFMALVFVLIQLPFLGILLRPEVQNTLGPPVALGFLIVEGVGMLVLLGFLWIFLDRRT